MLGAKKANLSIRRPLGGGSREKTGAGPECFWRFRAEFWYSIDLCEDARPLLPHI
jgi:hypothetical protein